MDNDRRSFLVRVVGATLVVALVGALCYLAARYASFLLLLFAGTLLAIFVDGLARLLARWLPVARGWTVLAVWLAIAAVLVGIGFLAGPRIADQAAALSSRVQEAARSIGSYLAGQAWGQWLLDEIQQFRAHLPGGSELVGPITRFFSTTVAWALNALVILFIGVYLSADPKLYLDNLLRLAPPGRRDRLRRVLRNIGHALHWWLIGRFSAMAVVGILTGTGLAVAGIPLAFTLGVLAALLAFVPFLGPITWLVPAVLVAWAAAPVKVLYVVVVYAVVQFLESYLITPLIQQRAVSIPPALLVAGQLFLGALFGLLGLLLATPLGVVLIVIVQMLYVEDVLGEKVAVLGSHARTARGAAAAAPRQRQNGPGGG